MGDARVGAVIPCRPSGVEPEGRLRGSGFAERQWLVRRDSQFVQVSELLYRLVELKRRHAEEPGAAREAQQMVTV